MNFHFFRHLLTLFCCVFLFIETNTAQPAPLPEKEGTIAGRILDAKKNAVPFATITLFNTDSTIVNGNISGEDGSFLISETGAGAFMLRINAIGFNEKWVANLNILPQAGGKKMGDITLTANTNVLQGVEVVGEKSLMQLSFDKRVFNVDKSTTSVGGDATDVLKNIPSLTVDPDGDVQLRGKGANILIDGKPATLFGGDVASALQSLPAASIESVEVITNPSSKYDAQGKGGIINIITKKEKRFGLNGNASLGAGTRDKYNGSLALNVRNDKWNAFLNSSFRAVRKYQRTRNQRFDAGNQLVSESYENNTRIFSGFFNTLGAEYSFDDNNSLMFTQNINTMRWGNEGTSDFAVYNNGEKFSTQVRTSDNLGKPLSSSSSLEYKRKFKTPKQTLNASTTYAKTWITRNQEFRTSFFDKNGVENRAGTVQSAPGDGSNASLTSIADFTTPVSKTAKLDAGLKSQLFWFESANNATIDSGNGAITDPVLQNNFRYQQQIQAAYVNYANEQGKWGYQAGLRLEYALYKGTTSAIGKTFTNTFLNLFPTAYLSYKPSEKNAFYLSYTRRTDRPSFWELMPYVDVSNPQDTSAGNPGLLPEFIHNTELNFSRQFPKNQLLMASVYFQYTQNLKERIRKFYPDGTSFQQPQNLNNATTFGIELTGRAQLLKNWDATLNYNFFKNQINGSLTDPTLNNSGYSWFAKLNTNLKLPAGFSFQANGNYEAPKVTAQGEQLQVWYLDLAVRKNFWNGKANLVLNVSDVFNARKYTTNYTFPGAFQTIYRDRETRIGNLTFSYRFGKNESKPAGKKNREQNTTTPAKDRDNIKQNDNGGDGGF